MKTRALGVLLLILLAVSPASAEQLSWSWTAPVDGTPVHHYVVRVSVDDSAFYLLTQEPTTPTITINQEPNREYRLQVAGVDIEGHQGGWSLVSDPDVWGAPGACGKPGRD